MRQILFYVSVLLLTISCGQRDEKSTPKVYENNSINDPWTLPLANDSNSAVLVYDTAYTLFPSICKNAKSTELTIEEINKIDKLINECTAKYSDSLYSLGAYKRQYVPVTNDYGQKIVWINFFCVDYSDFVYWKKQPIIASGGGKCYFQLKVNLTTKYYYDFSINGINY